MSNRNRDYTKYSNNSRNKTPEENTNVTPEDNTDVKPEENTEENTNGENNESKIGVVSNCKQLYVREKPDKKSKPIYVLKCETEVEISLEESVDNFYKVCTSDNNELITGYCVKDFIEIK